MIKTEITEIKGIPYSCTQLQASKALKIQFKLAKLVGEPLAKFLTAYNGNGDIMDGIISAFKNLDDPDFFPIFIELTSSCMRNGQKVEFEKDYGGNLREAWEAFIFAFKTNYLDFLEELPMVKDMMETFGKQTLK